MSVDQLQQATPAEQQNHYPGVEAFYVANSDWLKELGYPEVADFNSSVDKYHGEYVKRYENNPDGMRYPDPVSYAPALINHMTRHSESYRESAAQKREHREALEKAYTERPIRMQRSDSVRDRMEQTTDVFKDLDIEGIDLYPEVSFWFSRHPSSRNLSIAVTKTTDTFDPTWIISNADDSFRKAGVSRTPVERLMSNRHGLLVDRCDTFETEFLNTSALTVGEYGVDATKKIAHTVVVIGNFLKQNEDAFRGLHEEFGHTLVRAKDITGDEPVPMLSLYEGALTIGQALNSLIQEKIVNYETADQLIEDLVVQGTLLKFAKTFSRSGIIGPMNLSGRYIPGLLQVDEEHPKGTRLKLSPEYLKDQALQREGMLARYSGMVAASIVEGDKEDPDNDMTTVMTLEGCPATHSSYNKETGESRNVVSEVTRLFMGVYIKLDESKIGQAQNVNTVY